MSASPSARLSARPYLSVYAGVNVHEMSMSASLCCLSVYLFVSLSVILSIRLAVCPSVLIRNRLVSILTNMDMQTTFCVCLSVRRPVSLFIRVFVYLYLRRSVRLFVLPPLFVCLSVRPALCPFACSYGPVSV